MGSKTQTSTSNQTTTPINTAALQNIYGAVANAAQTPYTAYSGQLTAPVNGQQYAGIQNINAASTLAQPYYSQAAGLVNSASNPLTNAQIQQYQNPYTQSVVNATQAQFNDQNAQQQNSLKGTAAQQGALGGDRQAVAQAQLAGQQQLAQAPTIANLYANSYNSGLQTAENQYQQNPLAAASSLAGIGSGAQNAALQGANAQVGAGSLLQNTEQAQDQAAYQQYQAAQAFPYQQAAYLQQYGLPAALAQGTTSSGAQTSPGPNLFSQIAGLGIAGVGLATNPGVQAGAAALPALIGLKDGGRVNGYAPGGSVGYITSPLGYIDSGQGYIPQTKASQNTLQAPSLKYANQPQATNTPLTGTGSLSSLANSLGANNSVTINPNGSIAGALGPTSVGGAPLVGMGAPADGLSLADTGGLYAAGGLVHAIHQIHKTIKQSRRYDDGGTVGDSFADRFSPAVSSPLTVMDDPRSVNPDDPIRLDPEATQRWRDSVDHPNAALVADQGMPGPDGSPTPPFSPTANVTAPPSNPMQATSLPPQITNPDGDQPEPSSALGYASNPMTLNASPATANPTPVEQPDASAPMTNAHHFALSDKASQALIAAGLGMLASRSPFFGVALGEGGLQGLKTYSEATKEEQEAADKKLTHDQEAQRLLLSIEANKRAAASAPLIMGPNGKMITNPAYIAEKQAESDIKDKAPPGYQFADKDSKTLEAIPGGPQDPEQIKKLTAAKQGAGGLSEAAKDIKARQMINGDMSWATNLGRGAQAGRTLEDVSNRAAQILTEEGGMSPAEAGAHLSQKLQEFKATSTYKNTEARTAASREANLNLILNATEAAIPAALEASDAVGRTGWVPVNKIIQHGEVMASNPDLKRFGMANLQLAEHWARAMNPLGVMRESDRDKALEYLSTADSPETYRAAVDQLHKQILRERDAVRQGSSMPSPNAPAPNTAPAAIGAPAAPPAAAPAAKPKTIIQNGTTYQLQPDGSYK